MSGIVLSVLDVGYTAISDFKKSEISLDRDPFMSVGVFVGGWLYGLDRTTEWGAVASCCPVRFF